MKPLPRRVTDPWDLMATELPVEEPLGDFDDRGEPLGSFDDRVRIVCDRHGVEWDPAANGPNWKALAYALMYAHEPEFRPKGKAAPTPTERRRLLANFERSGMTLEEYTTWILEPTHKAARERIPEVFLTRKAPDTIRKDIQDAKDERKRVRQRMGQMVLAKQGKI